MRCTFGVGRGLLFAAWLIGCEGNADVGLEVDVEDTTETIIFGEDDTREPFEATPELASMGRSVAAIVATRQLTTDPSGQLTLATHTISDVEGKPYCEDERFAGQHGAAFCSSFLVAPDLVATAGHCVTLAGEIDPEQLCGLVSFVFGFENDAMGNTRTTFATDDVYRCAEVVDYFYEPRWSGADWAVVRLDRPVVGRVPLTVRVAGSPLPGTGLAVAGFPLGAPLKILDGGTIMSDGEGTSFRFRANLDGTYGFSGSPIVNAANQMVEGILVTGPAPGYQLDPARGCMREVHCPDAGCPGLVTASAASWFSHYTRTVVSGTNGADQVSIGESSDGSMTITINGVAQVLAPNQGRSLLIDLGRGADVMTSVETSRVLQIDGGTGRDTLLGGSGGDLIFTGRGIGNTVFGGEGDDYVVGGPDDDELHGDGGRDWLFGEAGPDEIWGDGDDDRIYGGGGADVLRGGEGVDTIEGGRGRNKIEE